MPPPQPLQPPLLPPGRRKMRPWALILIIVGVTLGLCLTGITVLGFIIGPTPPGKPVADTSTRAVAIKPAATSSAPRPTVAPTSPAAAAVVAPTAPAATKAAPKPRATAHPKPKPAPKPAPKPRPTTPPVQHGVHPGAFCAPPGAIGYTSKGTKMRCTLAAGDIRARWRRA